jgi:hypothetical protein
MTHWAALVLMAAAVSLAFAFLMRETPKERLFFGLKMFLGFIAFTLLAGWIAFFIPWGG